jgi:anion-transporting  ArsA/GET3 family ATPase
MLLAPPASLAQVVFVTGKGGVGKTTVAAGLALAALEDTSQAVFVEFSDGASGERALGKAGRAVKRVVINPHDAVIEAAKPLFGSSLLTRVALNNFAMKPFIAAAPAVRELAILALVLRCVEDNPGARVVVDMPATGHSLAWLKVPAQGRDLIRYGPLYELCDRLTRDLVRPGRASVVVVTLPERLVLQETLELCRALTEEVQLTPSRLIVNRVPAPLPSLALEDARRLAGSADDPKLASAARSFAQHLDARRVISEDLDNTLQEMLGEAARQAILLPRSAVDPSADMVAAWLRERGAA